MTISISMNCLGILVKCSLKILWLLSRFVMWFHKIFVMCFSIHNIFPQCFLNRHQEPLKAVSEMFKLTLVRITYEEFFLIFTVSVIGMDHKTRCVSSIIIYISSTKFFYLTRLVQKNYWKCINSNFLSNAVKNVSILVGI